MVLRGKYIKDYRGNKFWVHNNSTFFGKICHQIPERCFSFRGKKLPICARCSGLYLGIVLGFLLTFLIKDYLSFNISFLLSIDILLIFIEILDVAIKKDKLINDTNIKRFIIGILGGLAIGNIFCLLGLILIRFI